MLRCPVCGESNHHLATVCSRCGGFVQGRVENLDLFSTIWKVIERPSAAFHAVAIARYKNYSTVLSAAAGVGLVFALLWYLEAGDRTTSAVALLAGGFAAGPPLGVALVGAGTLLGGAALRLAGRTVALRNLYAVLAYALVPVTLSAVFVLPLAVFTFGRFFFSMNPPPWTLNPVSYSVMVAIGWGTALWSFLLLTTAIRVLLDERRLVAAAVAAAFVLCLAAAVLLLEFLLAPAAAI